MGALTISYLCALAAMIAAGFYLFIRLRLFLTSSTIFIVSLLLIYGPAVLSYTLSSGEAGYLIRMLSGWSPVPPHPNGIFAMMRAKGVDPDAVITAMNFSVALMYAGIIAGMELMARLMPARAGATQAALENWDSQKLQDESGSQRLLLIVVSLLSVLMLLVSVRENHIGTILHFFSIKDDNVARNLFRAQFAGSHSYLYRVALGAVAPMFVIWGFLSGAVSRSWLMILAAFLLFSVTMIGKVESLSKAPIVFFVLQLLFAALLTVTNRISWKIALLGGLAISLTIFAIVKIVMIFPAGEYPLLAAYSRVFEAESESLLENFAVFPALHPFMWGANLRPVAMLFGLPYTPSFSMVAYTWYGDPNLSSPSLFIADAWADFSYAGVLVYSVIAGAICRSIDFGFLAGGKSAVAIAVLGAVLWGIIVLISTALNIALFSGGLLLAPVLAGILVAAGRLASPDVPARPSIGS